MHIRGLRGFVAPATGPFVRSSWARDVGLLRSRLRGCRAGVLEGMLGDPGPCRTAFAIVTDDATEEFGMGRRVDLPAT